MDQVWGILRTVLLAGSGFVVANGIATSEEWQTIVAGIVAIGSAVWGYLHRAKMIAAPAQ